MGEYAKLARDAGATIIGGCCGTTPEHLSKMRDALENSEKGASPTLDRIVETLGALSSANDGTDENDKPAPRTRRRRRG